jgi:hypothetical protein
MERKVYWGTAIIAVLIFIATFTIPENKTPQKSDFPWVIEHPTAGTSQIFGLTLAKSSATEAQQRFSEVAIPILFKAPNGKLVVEVFFEEVRLADLKARIVLNIAVPDAELKGMFERGLRMNATGNGKEITMTPDDVANVMSMPISSLTYMPSVRLQESIFTKRFGQPAQRIREKKSGAIHWLYPLHGLDITLGGTEKPLLQYISPKDFDQLLQPLLANGEVMP